MRSLRRLLAFLAAPVLSIAAPSPLDEVISLPEFKVFENRPLPEREKWDYARVGNFEILSNTSARTTKRFAKDLSEFQIVLGIVAPTMVIKAEQPVMVVLCANNSQFERFQVKRGIASSREQATSLVRDSEIASIVVNFETRVVIEPGLGWFPGWFSRDINTTEEFIRQYIHLSLSQLHPRPPAWVAEGLANIYSNIDYNNKWIEIGLPRSFVNEVSSYSPGYSGMGGYTSNGFPIGGSTQDFAGFHRAVGSEYYGTSSFYGGGYGYYGGQSYTYRIPMTIMPMEKLFAVTYDSPLLKSGGKDNATSPGWRMQATAFVHMCLYGERGKYRLPFLKFVTRSYSEPVSEALFKECFGVSYKEMALRIRGYTEFTNYIGTTIKATDGGILYPADPINLRPANDAEIGRIKGETYRLAGQDEAARREFVIAYLRGERDPQLLASLGLMARQRQDDAKARTYLEAVAATKDPVPRPRAYLELAKLRAAAHAAKTGAKPYDTEQTVSLLTPLFVAQRLPQQLAAIYLEIARVWENTAVVPERDHLGALEYGVRLFPQNGELTLRTATLLIKHGHKADAAAMIYRAISTTRDPELRAKFEALRQKIDATPVTRTDTPTRFSPESQLGPELRQRLTDYRASRARALGELRTQLANTAPLPTAERTAALTAFAATQTPALRTLESEAARLEADLGWPPDQSDDFAPGLTELGAGNHSPSAAHAAILLAALRRPQGLSPPQTGLLREMIQELHDDAATRGAFAFFGPATARVRWPAHLPADLAAQLAAYGRDRDALKAELRDALVANAGLDADFARTIGLSSLAEQQAPRFAALAARTETIRQALALLSSRAAPDQPSTLPPELTTRLAAYQTSRTALQQDSRRTLLSLRSRLPAGCDIITAGDPPRLLLQAPGSAPDLTELRLDLALFNADYTKRSAALTRELAELRRLLASAAPGGAKSVDNLIQEFAGALARQTAPDLYRDCYAAVFQPGLSVEQRRLLFARAGEKSPALILEF